MSLNQVNSSGELERRAGLVNSEKINEMYDAFPSDSASASNKLITKSDADALFLGNIKNNDGYKKDSYRRCVCDTSCAPYYSGRLRPAF